ncbi:nitroreductase/quinone reductase family protein [Mycobacterium sp. NS-7484]|uniref:nitroreductase/quinone reductase family protein n=1 Tax=Mycobacterium sp. NS-7484 TaxID=1834161 RepID=UPI001E514BA6|nr:nitroreductase/quinone reductase family protein [Mycobacterium sp. NS-7484]
MSDRLLYRVTGGKWTTTAVSRIPSLTLLVTRRDGETAVVPLQYVSIDGSVYVIGTNWGRPKHPLWTGWLLRDSDCTINVQGREQRCSATPVEGPERGGVWQRIVEISPYYGQCQQRAQRELRIFRLDPTG